MVLVKRFFCAFVAASMLFTGSIQTVQAAMISTEQLAGSVVSVGGEQDRARIISTLSREDVQAALVARGIDPTQAKSRVAALTDEEASLILGYTKIFPFTRSVR